MGSNDEAAPVVRINAFPGMGKLTIAREVVQLYQDRHRQAILIDNHQLIDPVEARIPRHHADYQEQRRLQRAITFSKYLYPPEIRATTIIFTDFRSRNALGCSVAAEYKNAAAKSARPFLSVYLACDLEEHLQRVATVERRNDGTGKLVDGEILRSMRSRCELYTFGAENGLWLDVTHVSPRQAAASIHAYIKAKAYKSE
ncbi:uncharacterized protein K452DRAFT_359516 [Aplosporella prunicola CBS 121167]|uniref:Uncharacterized protein n=1 Tax=Aplosporella prunicola CBS 121167 TaxID=1176127 RepID=A0A6A6BFA7_9PEZI|nr:uncharacterized protein K452DRAFT_359516 [Aplosporella prunicola CBS 121167]KAF2141161.1 hypothetical protein K452DRAFT_359516 [Aplosporella prunicola CBS 121167]